MHEAQVARRAGRSSSFLTLTYTPQSLPADWSLDVRHWQLFAKRLRKQRGPFRFFMAAEYGTRTARPHYHAIVFGHDWRDDRQELKPGEFGSLYWSPSLELLWGLGQCSIGEVTWQSAAYVARYCLKKATGALAESQYERRDGERRWKVRPEFCTMSRRPGIGDEWIRRFKSDVYPSDECVMNGKRMRTPRYYDSKLSEAELAEVKARRKARALERRSDLTRERLEAREVILRGRNGGRGVL